MQRTSESTVNSVKYFSCGYCVNHMKFIVKNSVKKKRKFHAGVFLIHHVNHGYILFDTGYSEEIYRCGLIGKIYNFLNPTFVKPGDTIEEQLKSEGISPDEIRYIVLSHLHPDHIGDLKKFGNSEIFISQDCLSEYKKGRIRSLIFYKLLPDDFEERVKTIETFDLRLKYFKGKDLFGDGSLIVTQINGHAFGQIGLMIPAHDIFLGGDTAWGLEFLDRADEMSVFARFVQDDFKEYKEGFLLLKNLRNEGIRIYLSHDDCFEKELVK